MTQEQVVDLVEKWVCIDVAFKIRYPKNRPDVSGEALITGVDLRNELIREGSSLCINQLWSDLVRDGWVLRVDPRIEVLSWSIDSSVLSENVVPVPVPDSDLVDEWLAIVVGFKIRYPKESSDFDLVRDLIAKGTTYGILRTWYEIVEEGWTTNADPRIKLLAVDMNDTFFPTK